MKLFQGWKLPTKRSDAEHFTSYVHPREALAVEWRDFQPAVRPTTAVLRPA